ncbi:STAS-like domain-containing protein [uncultured Sphingomonas sp.]|uniref:STAS-like domain-containing protein n=1 Tax=uncultured Sphingomonas sp. TaxID=158754 RepID=UPI00157654A7
MINVAKQFSRAPAGRYISDGPNSGERFRDQYLVPALKTNGELTLELDGTRGYGSSFLEEAFGGLVRVGFAAVDLAKRIKFRTNDPSLVAEIESYWQ